jgi:hypothetical protein
MTKQSKKNKKYLESHGIEHIHISLPRETKRAFKSKLSDEGKNMTDYLLKFIYKYVGKNITNN